MWSCRLTTVNTCLFACIGWEMQQTQDNHQTRKQKPSEVLSILKPIAMKHKIKSITFDNGVEFMKHNELWIPTYFCFPHHPREKPQVERCNKDIRRYFPKKTIFEKISQGEIDRICEILNNKPMKVLWFKTPRELFEQTLHSEVALLTL